MSAIASRGIQTNCLKICTGDLNRKVSLEVRTLQEAGMGETKATMRFDVITRMWCKVDVYRDSRRFAGVVTDDRITHMFTARWTDKIDKLDGNGENFIRMTNRRNSKSTLYKIEGIADHNEQNKWVAFMCSERGLDGNEETNA
jgi:hypothetical protein